VLIGRPAADVRWPHVSIDNVAGGRIATEHLVAIGCHRIVHLAGPRGQTTMADRARGFQETMIGRLGEVIETSGAPEDGYARLRKRLNKLPEVDGVFAATDRLAVAVLALAADRRLAVPRDLAVVGFDDIPLAEFLRPTLSSIAQPARELGAVAIEMARRLAAGEEVSSRVLAPRLAERRSTLGPPPYV
jgi:LacI family transcriptional regulator